MAAAVPPIDVHCVHAGPDAPVQGPAAHPLVVATAVLRWGPVAAAPSGAARVQLPHHAMLRVFGRRLRLAAPPAGTPAPMVCPLDLALTGTAWARFLNELLTRGLLDAAPFSSSAALQLAIDRLDVSPAALEVKEPDLLPVGGLAAAAALAGDAAHAQRGAPRRASAAASAARPAAAALAALAPCLAPLACTPLSTLEVEGDAPWTVIAYLSGMLGPCLGQAERDRAGSQVQLGAHLLASGCISAYGLPPSANPQLLASYFKDYVLALEGALPPSLCAPNVAGLQWLEEARDAATYLRDDAGRRSVEDKRLYLLAPGAPLLFSALGDVRRGGEARDLVFALATALLPDARMSAPTTPLATAVRRVEASLAPRRAVLAAASANGASPQSVVAALVEHAASLRSPSAVAATDTAPSRSGAYGGDGGGGLAFGSLDAEFSSAPFVHFERTILSSPCHTPDERAGIFDLALAGTLRSTLRILVNAPSAAALSRRRPCLGKLAELRPFLPEYLASAVLRLYYSRHYHRDRPRRDLWNLDAHPALLGRFLKFDLDTDWYGSPDDPGLLYFLSSVETRRIGWRNHAVDPADHFCKPWLVRELADFGGALLGALGFALTPVQGYSFRSFFLLYADVVEEAISMAFQRPNYEENALTWLDMCNEQAHAALRLMGQLVKGFVNSSNFGQLDYILPEDCAPVAKLLAWQSDLSQITRCGSDPFEMMLAGIPADWRPPSVNLGEQLLLRESLGSSSSSQPGAIMNRWPLRSELRRRGVLSRYNGAGDSNAPGPSRRERRTNPPTEGRLERAAGRKRRHDSRRNRQRHRGEAAASAPSFANLD